MDKIPIPKWVPIASINTLFEILEPLGESRLVGGCVRDIICARVAKDIDIATTILPEKVIEVLRGHGIKVATIGSEYGTISAIVDHNIFEITTLRRDIKCFGRRAEIEYTDDWFEDAKRRDFTVNAMFLSTSGKLYDYFDGIGDSRNKIIRFIGDPNVRISEDYLRILRYFRFYSYFAGDVLDAASLQAVHDNAEHLTKLSGERIRNEMFHLLSKQYAKMAIMLMAQHKIWRHIGCGEPDIDKMDGYNFGQDILTNLSAIIRATNNQNICEAVCIRWRLSNKEQATLRLLCTQQYRMEHNSTIENKKLLYFLGPADFLNILNLTLIENPEVNLESAFWVLQNFYPPTFPLTGHDIKSMGFYGEAIRHKLNVATNLWIDSDFRLKKRELLKLLKSS